MNKKYIYNTSPHETYVVEPRAETQLQYETKYKTIYSYRKRKEKKTKKNTQSAIMPVQDMLYPSKASEAQKHKLKRLVQGPNSYFMDVKCPGCYNIQTVFSHVHAPVFCSSCSIQIAQPTGGKSRLTEGCSFRKKFD